MIGIRWRGRASSTIAIAAVLAIAVFGIGVRSSALAATDAIPPTTKLCKNFTGSPCWARTLNADPAASANLGCPNSAKPVPFFRRTGGLMCLGANDLVLITCYYVGAPSVDGDGYQDHVTEENGGSLRTTGHIPDAFIDLGFHYPNEVGIAHCS